MDTHHVLLTLLSFPAERQSSLGHTPHPHEDPLSHYDLPVNSHIPGHYDLPPLRRPPSPRRGPQWGPRQRRGHFSLLTVEGWEQREAAWTVTAPGRLGDWRSLCPRSPRCHALVSSTLPLCGAKRSCGCPDIQSRTPAGLSGESVTVTAARPCRLQPTLCSVLTMLFSPCRPGPFSLLMNEFHFSFYMFINTNFTFMVLLK